MIDKYRREIDAIDKEIAQLLNKRFDVVQKIADIKAENGLEVLDTTREALVYENISSVVDDDKRDFILDSYKAVVQSSKRYQQEKRQELSRKKVLVINGPNLNMLGRREKEQYGSFTYGDLVDALEKKARLLGMDIEVWQSNSESEIIEKVQGAGRYDALLINPAAYTHTSVAILDALLCLDLFIVEVHISNIAAREEFRSVTLSGRAADVIISGAGLDGYLKALELCSEKMLDK